MKVRTLRKKNKSHHIFFLLAFWQTQPNAQLHEKNAYLGDQIGFDRVSYIAFFLPRRLLLKRTLE